jgi:hypothetical protein
MSNQYTNYEPDIKLADFDGIVKDVMNPDKVINVAAYAYLSNQIPVNQSESLMGITDLPPSDFEKIMFLRKHYIVNHPESIYDMLNSGRISLLELMTLGEVYPEFLDEVRYIATEALIKKKESGEDLSIKTEYVLNGLFGTTKLRQELFEEQEEEPAGSADAGIAESTMTDVEKTLAG